MMIARSSQNHDRIAEPDVGTIRRKAKEGERETNGSWMRGNVCRVQRWQSVIQTNTSSNFSLVFLFHVLPIPDCFFPLLLLHEHWLEPTYVTYVTYTHTRHWLVDEFFPAFLLHGKWEAVPHQKRRRGEEKNKQENEMKEKGKRHHVKWELIFCCVL